MILNTPYIKTSSAKNWVFLDNCCFETKLCTTIADTYPPGPEPIMTTSNEFIVYLFLLYFYRMFYKINVKFCLKFNIKYFVKISHGNSFTIIQTI
jgi:hypothetical protein